jgi:ABC-type oligopeptide transport system ATPase subunit
MAALLEVRDLKKYFKTNSGMLHAVDGINLTLDEGKTLGVVGESGCGKSTLGRTILHLLEATEGEIFFDGKDITSPKGANYAGCAKRCRLYFRIRIPLLTRACRSANPYGSLILQGRLSKPICAQRRGSLWIRLA